MYGRSATGSPIVSDLSAPVRRAAADRVLVEALGQVQALEHELDGAGRRGRALVAAGEVTHDGLQAGDVAEQGDVLGRGDVVAGVDDGARLEGREHLAHAVGAAALLEDGEDRRLQQPLDDLAVATVLE